MLTVYGRATSSNVQALLWELEELGLSYQRLDYGETHGGLDTPAFLKMNPHGKIPVLKIGNTTLIAQNMARLEVELAIAEDRLAEHPFLCGDTLTLADIQFGHVLFRYYDIDIERRTCPAVRAYFDRLRKRAAYQKTVMVSYDTLKNTL